jgi:FdhD protein
MMTGSTFTRHEEIAWRGDHATPTSRLVAEEVAVALSYNGDTHAVMMATPADLADFGVGFTLTEGIVERANEIRSIELIASEFGIEVRMWLDGDRSAALAARRRSMSGPVGCGLCGIESLEQARREPVRLKSETGYHARDLLAAMQALAPRQILNQQTRSVHAVAFWHPSTGIGPVREDVGRHHALDKLAGALLGAGLSACDGAGLLTSRVSVKVIQKVAIIGAPLMMAISAPTTFGIQTAEDAGVTLLAIARDDGYGVLTHLYRIILPADATWRVDLPTAMRAS